MPSVDDLSIRPDPITDPPVIALLQAHMQTMLSLSPPGSCHFLDLDGLRAPDVSFWTGWRGDSLVTCGALKDLGEGHGEIKSMHTLAEQRGGGAGKTMLRHIIGVAQERDYQRLSLETGSMAGFEPARRLYESHGFEYCEPFGDYTEDPNSTYMTRAL